MGECAERAGPPMAWFNAILEEIRNRSDTIVWRLRPLAFLQWHSDHDGGNTVPDKVDYKEGRAEHVCKCRLFCYPPLSKAEIDKYVTEEGTALWRT